jgi:hypothetical protein
VSSDEPPVEQFLGERSRCRPRWSLSFRPFEPADHCPIYSHLTAEPTGRYSCRQGGWRSGRADEYRARRSPGRRERGCPRQPGKRATRLAAALTRACIPVWGFKKGHRSLTGYSRLVLGRVLWPCDVTCSEHGRDHSLLLGGDSFVNGACQNLPGDGPQAWTMAITQGELPLGAGAGRLAPIADSVLGSAGAAG